MSDTHHLDRAERALCVSVDSDTLAECDGLAKGGGRGARRASDDVRSPVHSGLWSLLGRGGMEAGHGRLRRGRRWQSLRRAS